MIKKIYSSVLLVLFLNFLSFSSLAQEQVREIAITIDDLPFVGTTHNKPGNLQREHDRFIKIMQSLIDHQVPATGFVIAGSIEQNQWALLQQFQEAGFTIGNHTYSHANLNRSDAEKYMQDIAKADEILTPLFSQEKFFRYPYLAEGRGDTKQKVHDFLSSNQYKVAPVTIDSKDFQFNEQLMSIHWRSREKNLEPIKRRYLSYIWNQTLRAEKKANGKPVKQILLIHANLLNSFCMSDIIQMYKDNGYKFITLSEALTPSPSEFKSTIPSISAANKQPIQKEEIAQKAPLKP
ncbi:MULTISPECIES: polysaccharide deacetylase family protein [Legionella]|uniref:polysaccharide deacetylase family protein n=1 Tax=Legionella TaxID=445 RepID=UPI000F8C6601|nr:MULTISPECIES: polysaccharide deacetylase family protein [Legionella]MCP0913652.1 polysaccharide deacetylase family protein [Legionella sp. 27cVA30]RUQ96322.1 polysaccharide deacetylase [Legionella septentrionalis]RUR09105.1 polysaccharide deacetylase [Legionella septentrionalis]RUR14166.1 polysaccharide deacetylase [Legionella septentrionalis]